MQDPQTPDPAAEKDNQDEHQPRHQRARVLKKATVLFKDGLRSAPCVVRNISETGARLEFEHAYLVPTEFELRIELEGFEVSCERRWEDGLTCGVQFISEKRPIKRARAQVLTSSDSALSRSEGSASLDDASTRFSAASRNDGVPGTVSPSRHRPRATFGKR